MAMTCHIMSWAHMTVVRRGLCVLTCESAIHPGRGRHSRPRTELRGISKQPGELAAVARGSLSVEKTIGFSYFEWRAMLKQFSAFVVVRYVQG